MRKSISTEKMFTDKSVHERFRLIAEAGFNYVEFGLWSTLDLVATKELLDELGLRVACISGDEAYSIIAPDERRPFLEFLEKSIDAANILECENLYIHSNALGPGGVMATGGLAGSVYTQVAAATRALAEAAVIAEQRHVFLQVEPVSTYVKPGYTMRTTSSAGDIVRVVDSPHVRLLYDVYHMQLMEGDITHTLRRYQDVLGYVHIADVPDRHEPGTGEINFAYFKEVLAEIGYDGFVGFELSPRDDPAACWKALHDF